MGGLAALVAALAAAMAWSSSRQQRRASGTMCLAASDGERKPKLGDVEGVFYTDARPAGAVPRGDDRPLSREHRRVQHEELGVRRLPADLRAGARLCCVFRGESVKCAVGDPAAAAATTQARSGARGPLEGRGFRVRLSGRRPPKLGCFLHRPPAQQEQCHDQARLPSREHRRVQHEELGVRRLSAILRRAGARLFFEAEGAKCAAGAPAAYPLPISAVYRLVSPASILCPSIHAVN